MNHVTRVSKKKLPTLQYFRGLAALFVLLHHITGSTYAQYDYQYLKGWFDPGWSGVDFFFVLSGFIIFYIHQEDIGDKQKLKPFVYKRITRIYPVYWIATLLFLPLFIRSGNSETSVIKSLILFPQKSHPILEVGWTLGYEMLFYVLFTIAILLKPRISLWIFSFWLIGIFINLGNIADASSQTGNLYVNYIFSHYNIEFILGCVSAYIVKNYDLKYKKTILIVGIIGFLGAWICIQVGLFTKFSIPRIFTFGISAALIIIGSALLDLKAKSQSVFKSLLYLGDASYSIYLTHLPIYFYVNIAFRATNMYNTLGYFLATTSIVLIVLFLGCLFHSFIEKPILSLIRKRIQINTTKSLTKKSA
jgi:peptidoglycan/LPS O-acetylase OafA/YrhL